MHLGWLVDGTDGGSMPRTAKPLSAREVATLKKPGTYFDGHGLALRVGPTGAKSWIFRYTGTDGQRHDLGLGPLHTDRARRGARAGADVPQATTGRQ